jgi:hypothetical protein
MKLVAKGRGRSVTFEAMSADDLTALAQELAQLGEEITRFIFDLIQRRKVIDPPSRPLWGPGAPGWPSAPPE